MAVVADERERIGRREHAEWRQRDERQRARLPAGREAAEHDQAGAEDSAGQFDDALGEGGVVAGAQLGQGGPADGANVGETGAGEQGEVGGGPGAHPARGGRASCGRRTPRRPCAEPLLASSAGGGRLNLRNARFVRDPRPLEDGCGCPACTRFSRAYVRHLVNQEEVLGLRLLSLHNLHFLLELTAGARVAIERGALAAYVAERLAQLAGGPQEDPWDN